MRPNWMTEDDLSILRFLEETDIVATAKVIAYNSTVSYSQVRNRIPVLDRRGMIEPPDFEPEGVKQTGTYRITEMGRRFVRGDVTVGEFREWESKREE